MPSPGPHWLTMIGTIVFVLAGCAILGLGTLTVVAAWIGRGEA